MIDDGQANRLGDNRWKIFQELQYGVLCTFVQTSEGMKKEREKKN